MSRKEKKVNANGYKQYGFVLKEDEDGKSAEKLLTLAKNKKSQLIVLALNDFAQRYQINDDPEQLLFAIKHHDRLNSIISQQTNPMLNNSTFNPSLSEEPQVSKTPKSSINETGEATLEANGFDINSLLGGFR